MRVPHRKRPLVIRRCNPRCSLGGALERADRAPAEARRDDPQRIRGPRGDLEGAGRPHVEREGARSMDRGASRLGRGAERWGGGGGSQQGEEPDGQRRGQRQLPEAPPTPGVGIRLPHGHSPAHQCVRRAHEALLRFPNRQPLKSPGTPISRVRPRLSLGEPGIARGAAAYWEVDPPCQAATWEDVVPTGAQPEWTRRAL